MRLQECPKCQVHEWSSGNGAFGDLFLLQRCPKCGGAMVELGDNETDKYLARVRARIADEKVVETALRTAHRLAESPEDS